jgi:hypothetical protein
VKSGLDPIQDAEPKDVSDYTPEIPTIRNYKLMDKLECHFVCPLQRANLGHGLHLLPVQSSLSNAMPLAIPHLTMRVVYLFSRSY